MYILMGNELKTLHDSAEGFAAEYVSVAQPGGSAAWPPRRADRRVVRFMGERMQATAEQNAAANLRRESMKPVRVRNR